MNYTTYNNINSTINITNHINYIIEDLMNASIKGNLNIIKDINKKLKNLNIQDNYNNTALILASNNNHLHIVRYLVEYGVDLNIQNQDGKTALIWASYYGHLEIVQYLVEKGAKLDIQDNNGWTALIWASYHGHLQVVKYLVEKSVDINTQNNKGKTALFWASFNGHLEVVKILVDNGADINYKDIDNKTIIYHIIDKLRNYQIDYQIEIIKYLITKNKNILSEDILSIIKSKNLDLYEFIFDKIKFKINKRFKDNNSIYYFNLYNIVHSKNSNLLYKLIKKPYYSNILMNTKRKNLSFNNIKEKLNQF